MEDIEMLKKIAIVLTSLMLAVSAAGCSAIVQKDSSDSIITIVETNQADATSGKSDTTSSSGTDTQAASSTTNSEETASSVESTSTDEGTSIESSSSGVTSSTENASSADSVSEETASSDLFSNRDLSQTADLSEAVYYEAADDTTITLTEAGVYVFSGSAENYTIIVEASDEDKVQIVLNSLSVTNDDTPVIYIKNADKTFVTTAEGTENTLTVSGSFTADGDTNTDAVIFSRDDLVLNGLGTLNISSTDNGISCKDDLKVTGGTINISCVSDALEANDSILVGGGTVNINSRKDGLHTENDEDDTVGYIVITGGTLNISASDDGIHATTYIQIDSGVLNISASEGIEATYIQINGGTIQIDASDDGINAGRKSTALSVAIEINGVDLTVNMGQGDTDGIDSNGDLIITGGTISVNAQSPFDYDGNCTYTGGTIIVNGTETNEITNQMMGGGFGGGFGGGGRR